MEMLMIELPGGEFWMGSPEGGGDANEHPRHRVRVSAFAIGETPVTVAQWNAVLPKDLRKGASDEPVVNVSWKNAMRFCEAASAKAGFPYRLPTEAEWEYACRAGSEGRWCFGDDGARLGEYAWYAGNSGGKLHPVRQKRPNAYGLYDMHGLVWEWCSDGWDAEAYAKRGKEVVDNPIVDNGNVEFRVVRGGSFLFDAVSTRSANRNWNRSRNQLWIQGFRCVRGPRRELPEFQPAPRQEWRGDVPCHQ